MARWRAHDSRLQRRSGATALRFTSWIPIFLFGQFRSTRAWFAPWPGLRLHLTQTRMWCGEMSCGETAIRYTRLLLKAGRYHTATFIALGSLLPRFPKSFTAPPTRMPAWSYFLREPAGFGATRVISSLP